MRPAYLDATYATLQSLFTPHFSIVLVLFQFYKNYLVSVCCLCSCTKTVLFSFCLFTCWLNSTTASHITAPVPQTTQNTKEHNRTKHNISTTNNNHVQCHYNKFTNRCRYKTPLTASHVTYNKHISIQQSAVHISNEPKLPTVTDVRYIIRKRWEARV